MHVTGILLPATTESIENQAASAPNTEKTVLDGEIVCLDKVGRPQFRDLLFHRAEPCFESIASCFSKVPGMRR